MHATPKGRHCTRCNLEYCSQPSKDWAHKLQLCAELWKLEAGFLLDRWMLAAGRWRLTAPSLA